MINIVSIVFLQIFWFCVVYGLNYSQAWLFYPLSFIFVYIFYKAIKPEISKFDLIFNLLFFSMWGIVQDIFLKEMNLISDSTSLLALNSLWVVLNIYYFNIFKKFKNLPIFLLSILGASSAFASYYYGLKISGNIVEPNELLSLIIIVGVSWALFFPLSIFMYYKFSFLDFVLDKTILFSFDKTGFIRHRLKFLEDISKINLSGKSILVTGATSGIGLSCAKTLSKQGAIVLGLGRSIETASKNNPNINYSALDIGDWHAIKEFSVNVEGCFDTLILNAGAMPDELKLNSEGLELQFASQVIGHYFLFKSLNERSKLKKGCRICFVSSGGMYLRQLDVDQLFNNIDVSAYDKVDTYANVKRAQVTLVEVLSQIESYKGYTFASMHPGWVATPGLENALPKFYKLLTKILRSMDEGADTLIWIASTSSELNSGDLYFDRKSVAKVISKKYEVSDEQKKQLIEQIENSLRVI